MAFALCLLSACGSDSSDDGAGGSSGGSGATGPVCTQPSDCRTYSSYCDGCQCFALGANEADPPCNGTPVSCLVDPCLDRTATCLGGTCALTERN